MHEAFPSELNECTLAFDLDEHRFMFISNDVIKVLGYPAADFYRNTNLLFENIDRHYQDSVKTQTGKLATGATIELYYKFITPGGAVKGVYERKSLIADENSGHKILLSVIRDHLPEKLRLQDEAKFKSQEPRVFLLSKQILMAKILTGFSPLLFSPGYSNGFETHRYAKKN